MATTAPIDTTIEVVTPENIAFDYQLAGPFRRLPAYLIDLAVRIIIFLAVLALVGVVLATVGFTFRSTFAFSLFTAVAIVLYFIQSWFFGIFFETYYNGRTPGKWTLGLRVISVDGRPISGMQALLRNLIRDIDLMPATLFSSFDTENPYLSIPLMTGIVGLITMTMTRRMQRLGDLAAGTMVVLDERNWSLPGVRVDDIRVPALASFIPADFRPTPTLAKTLANYAERRSYLGLGRRREIAKHLANPLIERFEFRQDIDPDLMLFALYYRTFLADPASPILDVGPLAGFSPLAKDAASPTAATSEIEQPLGVAP